jgi:hypothetical protein
VACLRGHRPTRGDAGVGTDMIPADPDGECGVVRNRDGEGVTEPPNYDGPHVPVIVIMTSDSHTYVPHNLKGLLSSEHDLITGVL